MWSAFFFLINNMDKQEIYTQLVSILTPLCQAQGLELWGIELRFGAGGKHKLVRIYLDSPHGVSVDECAKISRHVSLALDVEDIIVGAYTLEVSSPGLERPFFTLKQLEPYKEHTIRIRLYKAKDGQKNFTGRLQVVDPPKFQLVDNNNVFEFSWDEVSTAHLVHEF